MSGTNQLQIPAVAEGDSESFELLRVWIAHQGQHVSLRTDVWDDPAAWGIMLSDLARHVANSYQQEKGFDQNKTLQRIKATFDLELTSPTDDVVKS